MGPPGGRAGPIVLGPGGLFWKRRRAGVGFRWVVPDTHGYFFPPPGRLSSKSGADMIISCSDQRLVGSHRKVSHSRGSVGWCSKGCTRTPTLAGWCSRCCVDGVVLGWCSKKLSQNPRGSMGWCSKSLGGAPKSCPRIPMARWGGVPQVGVVFQKVVPESPRLHGVVFQTCAPKSRPRIPTLYIT